MWLLVYPCTAYEPSTYHLISLMYSIDNVRKSSGAPFRYTNTLISFFQYFYVGSLILVASNATDGCMSVLDILHRNNNLAVSL